MLAFSEVSRNLINSVTTNHFEWYGHWKLKLASLDLQRSSCLTNSWMVGFERIIRASFYLSLSEISSCEAIDRQTSSFTNGELLLGSLLLGQSHCGFIGSFNVIRLLSDMELDVTVGRKVGWDTTMSSVRSSSAADSSLSAHMSNSALFWVERLSQGIWFQVLEEGKDVLAWLLGESTIGVIHVFAHGMMSRTSSESPERDDTFVCNDIFHVLNGLEQIESSAGSGCFICVLKVSSQVINSAFGR